MLPFRFNFVKILWSLILLEIWLSSGAYWKVSFINYTFGLAFTSHLKDKGKIIMSEFLLVDKQQTVLK